MKLSKGIFYSRTPNTTAGIKLHKGLTYISVWSVAVAGIDITIDAPVAIVIVEGIPPIIVVTTKDITPYCLYLVPLTYSVTEKALTYSVTQAPLVYSIEEVSKCTR